MEQATLIQILLGSASFALMAVTVMVAVVAIVGYVKIKEHAQIMAESAAQDKMRSFLEESDIRAMLREEIKREANALYSDMEKSPGHDTGDFTHSNTTKENQQ